MIIEDPLEFIVETTDTYDQTEEVSLPLALRKGPESHIENMIEQYWLVLL